MICTDLSPKRQANIAGAGQGLVLGRQIHPQGIGKGKYTPLKRVTPQTSCSRGWEAK